MIKVYGDVMLDRWIIGEASRISPEAPVPVLLETHQELKPGGAGNVALNISSLVGETGLYGAISTDKEGYQLVECFDKTKNINFNVVMDATVTTSKNRVVGQNGQQIVRWDREEQYCKNTAFEKLLQEINKDDIVVVSDYAKGVIKKDTVRILVSNGCKVIVDPKQSPDFYNGAFLVKPNMKEYTEWFGTFKKELAIVHLKNHKWKYLVVTDGANGMHVLCDDLSYRHFKEPVKEVADVTGAGDTALAVIAYGINLGMDIFKACELACYASARSVEHRGVHVVTMQDIKRKVIFTNGVFDVLHAGHLELLKYAKSRGDKLVVGINSDSSVKRLKGSNRPINDIATRIEQLEVLPWVDEVKVFTEDTPENLLKTVNPDLIIKGGDYIIETVVGHQDYDVEIFPTVKGKSTTNIVERINENFSNRT